jgi:hypothetical protein
MFVRLFKLCKFGVKGHIDYSENYVPIEILISSITAMTDYMIYFDGQAIQIDESLDEIKMRIAKAES